VTAKPRTAILYCRISDANGTSAGVDTQEADLRKHARKLGWKVGRVIVENDTSAFKRRKVTLPNGERAMRVVRPGWRSMLDDLAAGHADGLLALDLDRAARDPRDLEDLIDVVESRTPRVAVESITGSLKLANDGDVTMARIMVAIANKSSRDTSRRVTRHMLRLAEEGKTYGGSRRYGLNEDDTIREDEAVVIKVAAERILAGVGIAGVVKDLNRRGVPAHRGGKWESQSLRSMLLSPRIAGLSSFHGEIIEGVTPPWAPILDRSTWQALCTLLNSPDRRTSPGPTPRHLLSHLAVCGHPSHPDDERPVMVKGWAGGGNGVRPSPRIPAYRCSEVGHLAVAQAAVDDYVEAEVIERIRRPDAAKLLVPRIEVDMDGLANEANSLRARIAALGDLVETGDMSPAEYRKRKTRLTEKLTSIEATMTASVGTSALSGIAGRKDAAEVWDGLDLDRKKAVIDALMTVTVLPAASRGKGFDPDRVEIDWRG
jgi:DNA invertase Pin-like site-specific DNA recombinase